jgi:predicted GNAT family acetyltransferase
MTTRRARGLRTLPATVSGRHRPGSVGDMSSARAVVRNDERSRYELVVDGAVVGIADFVVQGDVVVVPHTEIAAHLRGQGLGAVLVRGVLDDIRGAGRTVVPRCWYVAEFVDANPDYADLVA